MEAWREGAMLARREAAGESRRLEVAGAGATAWDDEATDARGVAEGSIGGHTREAIDGGLYGENAMRGGQEQGDDMAREPGADGRECVMDETEATGADWQR